MADHNAIAKKVDQLSLNFRKRLRAVLWIDIIPVDPGKLFVGACDVDGFGVAHKSVEYDLTLIVDNRDAAEDLADVGPHHFAVDGNFLGKDTTMWPYCFRGFARCCVHCAFFDLNI